MKVNKQKITKVLIIISIVLMVIGIIVGIETTSEIKEGGMPKENIYFDGSDVTELSKGFVEIGSTILGIVVGIYFGMIVVGIWIIYGIILLVIKIVNKIKARNIK